MVIKVVAVTGISLVALAACSGHPGQPVEVGSAVPPAEAGGDPSAGKATPIDGEWRLTGLAGKSTSARGEDLASLELVYRFENGHGSVREGGAARGDGFAYSADGRHVRISDGEEEGLPDTGEIFESLALRQYNYTISEDAMDWWIHDQSARNPGGRRTILTFRRVGDPPAGAVPTADSLEGGAVAGGHEPIDGTWRLRQVMGTRIPRMAVSMVYRFENGSGTFEKNGKPKGDGFRFTADSSRITISGADGEGLMDAGQDSRHYSHYNYTIEGREMSWWVNDSFSPGDRKVLYVFERSG